MSTWSRRVQQQNNGTTGRGHELRTQELGALPAEQQPSALLSQSTAWERNAITLRRPPSAPALLATFHHFWRGQRSAFKPLQVLNRRAVLRFQPR
eukprot:5273107-Pyramimonas_sp.AAC.2